MIRARAQVILSTERCAPPISVSRRRRPSGRPHGTPWNDRRSAVIRSKSCASFRRRVPALRPSAALVSGRVPVPPPQKKNENENENSARTTANETRGNVRERKLVFLFFCLARFLARPSPSSRLPVLFSVRCCRRAVKKKQNKKRRKAAEKNGEFR